LHAVLDSGVPYEIRTTVHPALLTDDDLLAMAAELRADGVRRWILQLFRPEGCRDRDLAARPDWARLRALLPALTSLVPEVVARGE